MKSKSFMYRSVLEEAKEEVMLFYNCWEEYKKRVEECSNIISKGKVKFKQKFLPTYFVGDFKSEDYKFVLFGLNPGFKEEQNIKEEKCKHPRNNENPWDSYLRCVKQFFIWFKQKGFKSPYYKRLFNLFLGLDRRINQYANLWEYYQAHLINIDLIPYHSTKFSGLNINNKVSVYLKGRLLSNLKFLDDMVRNIKLIIFNGKIFYWLFREQLKKESFFRRIRKVNAYLFKMDNVINENNFAKISGVYGLLFDKFVTQSFFGVKNEDLKQLGRELSYQIY